MYMYLLNDIAVSSNEHNSERGQARPLTGTSTVPSALNLAEPSMNSIVVEYSSTAQWQSSLVHSLDQKGELETGNDSKGVLNASLRLIIILQPNSTSDQKPPKHASRQGKYCVPQHFVKEIIHTVAEGSDF